MAASFASDMLAGYPFRQFLQERQLMQDSRMLDFWSDVRQYMDADDGYLDPYGIPMKRKLARTLTDKYLTLNNDLEYDIFSEQLKMTLYQSLNSRDDVILMSYAQNIISQVSIIIFKMWISLARIKVLFFFYYRTNQMQLVFFLNAEMCYARS